MQKSAAHNGILVATLAAIQLFAAAAFAQQQTPLFQPLPQSQQPAATQSAPAAPSDPDNNPFAAAVRAMAARRNPNAAAPAPAATPAAPANATPAGTWGKPLGVPANATNAPAGPGTAKPAAGILAAPVPVTDTSAEPSPADKPPSPASITFQDGLLTVHAYNSSLTQILRDSAARTGMEMDGTPSDERVFGDFGPAPVTKVLAQLLDGGPSNYVVFGMNSNHAPRSLVISPRDSLSPADVAANNHVAAANNSDDEDEDQPQQPVPVNGFRPLVPQNVITPPQAARTPQEILDEMQHRREQEQQQ